MEEVRRYKLCGGAGGEWYVRIGDCRVLWEEDADALCKVVIGSVIGIHVGPGAIAVAFFER